MVSAFLRSLADFCHCNFQGYGTDAFVFLRAVAENAQEVLPSYSERELRYVNEEGGVEKKASSWHSPLLRANSHTGTKRCRTISTTTG